VRNREKKEKQCLYCGNDIPNRNVYCNNKCQAEYKRKYIFEKLEKNDLTRYTKCSSIHEAMKRYLIHKHGEKCMKCGWEEVNEYTKIIPIQMNHIDGNPTNHDLSNVELLCPNCHSLTEFFGSRGKGRKERYQN
jgi:hypothetical protein